MKLPRLSTRLLTTVAIIAVAVVAAGLLYLRSVRNPWTRDAQVTADIVMIAPRVTGWVSGVAVRDNQLVEEGEVLFEIDRSDFELAVSSARVQLEQTRQQVEALEAAVVAAEAGVSEAEAGVTTAIADIDSEEAQVASADGGVAAAEAGLQAAQSSIDRDQAALDQAIRDRDRAQRLADDRAGSVATAESRAAAAKKAQASLEGSRAGKLEAQAALDQASAALRKAQAGLASAEASRGEADARLTSARAGLAQAKANLGVPGEENPQIRASKVSLAQAELDLERTAIRAPADGYVTNLNVDVGDYATPGTPMLAFVNTATFHVQGFFQETQLRHISLGDRAVITLMSHRGQPIKGVVESIGWAINPPDVATTEGTDGLVPQVQPSFDWIRLAQRVPVRVKLEEIPEDIELISGTTASVVIKPGS
jgi:multidrug resistance efflux pump